MRLKCNKGECLIKDKNLTNLYCQGSQKNEIAQKEQKLARGIGSTILMGSIIRYLSISQFYKQVYSMFGGNGGQNIQCKTFSYRKFFYHSVECEFCAWYSYVGRKNGRIEINKNK